jgi:PEGA domain.
VDIKLSGIIRWIVGLLFIVTAVSVLAQGHILAFIFSILIAVVCIPAIAEPIERKINVSMSGPVRFILVFVLLISFGVVAPQTTSTQNNTQIAAPPVDTHTSSADVPTTTNISNATSSSNATPISTVTSNNKGTLDIITSPTGATITVDGVSEGVSPIEGLSVDAGTHSITVYLSGYAPQKEKVEVANSKTKKLFYTLFPEADKSTTSTSIQGITSNSTSQESSDSTTSKTTTQLSESKRNELIGYVKQYTGSTEITATFIPSNDGVRNGLMVVDFYLDEIPNATDLNNNIADIIILSKAMAKESGIQNVDVSVCAAYKTGRGLGLGSYDSSTGKTNIDVSDCHL